MSNKNKMKAPKSYTEFFKDRLREELDRTSMVDLEVLAQIVKVCHSIEKYLKKDPSKFPGQFDFRAWITASQHLTDHGYSEWKDHQQAIAYDGNWELYFNGKIQKCEKCHSYAFRNDINNPKDEKQDIWTCIECKTDFTWPKTTEENEG